MYIVYCISAKLRYLGKKLGTNKRSEKHHQRTTKSSDQENCGFHNRGSMTLISCVPCAYYAYPFHKRTLDYNTFVCHLISFAGSFFFFSFESHYYYCLTIIHTLTHSAGHSAFISQWLAYIKFCETPKI